MIWRTNGYSHLRGRDAAKTVDDAEERRLQGHLRLLLDRQQHGDGLDRLRDTAERKRSGRRHLRAGTHGFASGAGFQGCAIAIDGKGIADCTATERLRESGGPVRRLPHGAYRTQDVTLARL